METTELEYTTERLDHLGIVAGICKQSRLIEVIDESLATPSGRKVSCGQVVQAMVLNALGLTGRALYLMPEYMRNKPVDLLIGEGLVADDFNDDTLQKRTFQCRADAEAAATQLGDKLPWHRPQAQVVPLKKYAKPGRPAKDVGTMADNAGWRKA